ncbi:hypothetical protein ACFL5U_02825 [Candidatus Margulisiibacteriota bacterium]
MINSCITTIESLQALFKDDFARSLSEVFDRLECDIQQKETSERRALSAHGAGQGYSQYIRAHEYQRGQAIARKASIQREGLGRARAFSTNIVATLNKMHYHAVWLGENGVRET